MMIQNQMKMAEVILLDYHLLPIISRFGMNLGFGDKTILQVCKEHDVDPDFFLEILNSFHNRDYFPQKHLQGFSLALIIDYLRKSHEYYLHTKIPHIEHLLHQLNHSLEESASETVRLIDRFFTEYRNELTDHIGREETKVYPYIFSVEEAFNSKSPSKEILLRIRAYSIDDFEEEHDNVEDKLFDLKNILIKYIPVPVDPQLSHTLLIELFRLETDLNDHARIEDKVLVPKVRYMEKWLLEHAKV